jgi:hypothetical protein
VSEVPPNQPQQGPQPATPGDAANELISLQICQNITADGQAQNVGTQFSSQTPTLGIWWSLRPNPQPRTVQVVIYHDRQRFQSVPVPVKANQSVGWITLSATNGDRFPPGNWTVVLQGNNAVLGVQPFVLTP